MKVTNAEVAAAEDLVDSYAGIVSPGDVRRTFWHAMSDLAGSVHLESRPEMAVRLARVRLGDRLRSDGTFGAPDGTDRPGQEPAEGEQSSTRTRTRQGGRHDRY